MPPRKRTIIESSPEANDSSDERAPIKSARSAAVTATRSARNNASQSEKAPPSTPPFKTRSARSNSVTSSTSTTPKKKRSREANNLFIDMKTPVMRAARIPSRPTESPKKPAAIKTSTKTSTTATVPTAKATPIKKPAPITPKKASKASAPSPKKKVAVPRKAPASKKSTAAVVEDEGPASGEDTEDKISKEEEASNEESEKSESESDHAMEVDESSMNTQSPADDSWVYTGLLTDDQDDANSSGSSIVLEHVIRAHSRSTHEGQDETEADTWAVAFQPTLPVIRSHHGPAANRAAHGRYNSGKSSNLVATCGSNTVCLIDCRLGKVVVKYSHVEEEEFMSLAWTTLDHYAEDILKENGSDDEDRTKSKKNAPAKKLVAVKSKGAAESKKEDSSSMTLEGGHSQANILAAGGRLGSIKLINPTQNTCYKYLHGHTDAILSLKFSLTNPRWLFSASSDGSVRLWDIGSLTGYESEACCLAKFGGLEGEVASITAIGVSEKYLIIGTEKGVMARYNLFQLIKILDKRTAGAAIVNVKPDRVFPNSQEWHESSVDDILYIPYFSERSYAVRKAHGTLGSTKPKKSQPIKKSKKKKTTAEAKIGPTKRGRGRPLKHKTPEADDSDENNEEEEEEEGEEQESGESEDDRDEEEDDDDDDDDGEFVFASREDSQGEIIVWDASKSTAEDAELKTILEWSIADSWTKFTLAENMVPSSLLPPTSPAATATRGRGGRRGGAGRGRGGRGGGQAKGKDENTTTDTSSWVSWATKRQNTLVAGSMDGKVFLYDLGVRPKLTKGNIVAQKPTKVISHPDSTELFRDVAVSQDLSTIVAGDWNNRIFVWHRATA